MITVHGEKGKKMPSLIDLDALTERIKRELWSWEAKTLIDYLSEQPTVDAVEVVRCKDCEYSCPFTEEELKYPYRVGEWHCAFWEAEMHEDDYCSCGVRREDETD